MVVTPSTGRNEDTPGGRMPLAARRANSNRGAVAEDPTMNGDCEHEFMVFPTAVADGWLLLQCAKCGANATVDEPTEEEWSTAIYGPTDPYPWQDVSRVTLLDYYFGVGKI